MVLYNDKFILEYIKQNIHNIYCILNLLKYNNNFINYIFNKQDTI